MAGRCHTTQHDFCWVLAVGHGHRQWPWPYSKVHNKQGGGAYPTDRSWPWGGCPPCCRVKFPIPRVPDRGRIFFDFFRFGHFRSREGSGWTGFVKLVTNHCLTACGDHSRSVSCNICPFLVVRGSTAHPPGRQVRVLNHWAAARRSWRSRRAAGGSLGRWSPEIRLGR